MDVSAHEITILPGSRIRFNDVESKQSRVVVLKEEVNVQATKRTTITVEDIKEQNGKSKKNS